MILVVDDQREIGLVTLKSLSRSGYAARYACSGPEALRMMREKRPALLLLDFSMPGMDGIAVIKEMRVDPTLHDIPVIMFSAREGQFRQQALDAGAAVFIQKAAVKWSEIVEEIERLLPHE